MTYRRGEWFQTYSGRQYWPLDPLPDDVILDDVAIGLARICRFGGHTCRFYSVAQHSIFVSYHVPAYLALQGLMHDAHEAYTGDMIRPLKVGIRNYIGTGWDVIENMNQNAITIALGGAILGDEAHKLVKSADNKALATERRDLLLPTEHEWHSGGEVAVDEKIIPMRSDEAFIAFINRYEELVSMKIP